jgi:hypothetical protein
MVYAKYDYGYETKEAEMGGSYSTHGKYEKYVGNRLVERFSSI